MRHARLIEQIVVATALLMFSACGSHTQAPTNVLRVGNHAEPDTLDPTLEFTATKHESSAIFSRGWWVRDAKGEIADGVSTSHAESADGLVWTFDLRRSTWSDGAPLTAQDFVYAFRRLLDPKTAAQGAFLAFPIKNAKAVNAGTMPLDSLGVRATGDQTLEVTLEQPTPYLLQLLTQQVFDPVPEHVIARGGANWTKAGAMVSNGAYTLVEACAERLHSCGEEPALLRSARGVDPKRHVLSGRRWPHPNLNAIKRARSTSPTLFRRARSRP